MLSADIDNIHAEIARIDALARAAFGRRWNFATVTIWGSEHRGRNTAVGLTLHITGDSRSFAGAGPADVIRDAERYIRAHDPRELEAEGWATLGATVAP